MHNGSISAVIEDMLPSQERQVDRLLTSLRDAWGNAPWTARADYLRATLALALRGGGPILECGSGLTTLVLAVAARHTARAVVSLENDPRWARTVAEALARHGLAQVRIVLAPLRDYGAFHWYDIAGLELPGKFSLVICDGPPGSTPGGRYGLLPVMRERLAFDCVILLDDAERPGEQEALARWGREFGLGVQSCAPDGHYCRVSRAWID